MSTVIPLPVHDPDTAVRRSLRMIQPRTPGQLHAWLKSVLGFHMPRTPMVPGHDAPFEYLLHAYFEGQTTRDCVVWANRGGGKTQLGAIATLLDMLFKPGVQIRILGGSFDQSSKMHRYLKRMVENDVFHDLIAGNCTGRFVELTNGSRVEVLSQSERSIRGQRVHKLRCDEVELFTNDVWEAAQLVTRSGRCGDTWVTGCVEALSTMHKPYGLMQKLVHEAELASRRVFRWSVLDTLRHCPPQRACETCPLWNDCQGRAKLQQARGFVEIEDAIQQRRRVGLHMWNAEMLCTEPDRSNSVYPEFDAHMHVINDDIFNSAKPTGMQFIAGVDFGYRAPTVVLWALHDPDHDVVTVVDELILREHTTEQVIALVRQRMIERGIVDKYAQSAGGWFGADPAGHHRQEHTGTSTIALWKRAGLTVRTRSMEIAPGIASVRTRLRRADGSIGLRIHRRCEQLIEALRKYRYPDEAQAGNIDPDKRSPLKDGPDHACDALRYMIVNMDGDGSRSGGRRY